MHNSVSYLMCCCITVTSKGSLGSTQLPNCKLAADKNLCLSMQKVNFAYFCEKYKKIKLSYMCTDLQQHALRIQSTRMEFGPFIHSEKSRLQKKSNFHIFFVKNTGK